MKEKIQENEQKLQQMINQINLGKQQISQLEQEALKVQGRIELLRELEADKPKEVKK